MKGDCGDGVETGGAAQETTPGPLSCERFLDDINGNSDLTGINRPRERLSSTLGGMRGVVFRLAEELFADFEKARGEKRVWAGRGLQLWYHCVHIEAIHACH